MVQFGGWAIGMRNMIIYELEADYSHYLEALGAPRSLIRRYAFNNAVLPQLSGLALQLGVIVAGALVTEVVFSYPGIGYLLLAAIQNQDYFLIQGAFLFIIIGWLIRETRDWLASTPLSSLNKLRPYLSSILVGLALVLIVVVYLLFQKCRLPGSRCHWLFGPAFWSSGPNNRM